MRFNIIPESAELIGTVRTLNPEMRALIMRRMDEMARDIAQAYGGSAEIEWQNNTVVTFQRSGVNRVQMVPSLEAVAGKKNVQTTIASTGVKTSLIIKKSCLAFSSF